MDEEETCLECSRPSYAGKICRKCKEDQVDIEEPTNNEQD